MESISVHEKGKPIVDTIQENQKLNTFRICGTSLALISESFLLFTLLSIFLHSAAHGEHGLEDLL